MKSYPLSVLVFASAAPAISAAPTMFDVFHRQQVDSANVSYFCFRIPALVRRADDALIAFAEGRHVNCDDAGDVRIVRRISYDEGETWSDIDQVKVELGHTIGNPCPIVDLVTGHIHLLYSRDNKEVFVTRSTDGGESWGASTNLTASLKLGSTRRASLLQPAHRAACSSLRVDWSAASTTMGSTARAARLSSRTTMVQRGGAAPRC